MKTRILVMLMATLLFIPLASLAKISISGQGINVIVTMGPEDVRELGERAAKQIEAETKVQNDAVLQKRVDAAAKTVGASYKHPVKILDLPEVNGFCTFDGRIYVTTGLLKMVSDDELCFVLAHETAHSVNNDPENYFKDQIKAQIAFANAGVEGAVPNILLKIGEMSYSRDQERRADQEGVSDLISAQIDPQSAVTLLEKLGKLHAGPTGLSRYFASHPSAKKRIALVKAEIERIQKEQEERASQLPLPATKFAHPGVKILVMVTIADPQIQKIKSTPEIAGSKLTDEFKAYLNSLGTFVFVEHQQISQSAASVDANEELALAKKAGVRYFIRLRVLKLDLKLKDNLFSVKHATRWLIDYQGTLYRVADQKIVADITERFDWTSKARRTKDDPGNKKEFYEKKMAEAKFLTDFVNKLLANEFPSDG